MPQTLTPMISHPFVISRCRSVLWLLASTKVEGRLYVSYLVLALPIQSAQMILSEDGRKWMKMATFKTLSSASKPTPTVLQDGLPYTQGIVWQFLCTFYATWVATTRRLLDLYDLRQMHSELMRFCSAKKMFVFFLTGDGHKCRTFPGMFSTLLCLDLR